MTDNAVAGGKGGLVWTPLFVKDGVHPFDRINWVLDDITILGRDGKPIFEQVGVEVPDFWSPESRKIAASKYFRGQIGTPKREKSVKQLISRVADTIAKYGLASNYFQDEHSAENFRLDLTHLLVNQLMAFNSPVWFNVGIIEKPQCSACFILSVKDDMESILNWYKVEGRIFKRGSGAGINLSTLRSSKEPLSVGGLASGPVSFMQGADSIANVIRSGGATRRAAKMVILNIDHPDVHDFIRCKVEMERMARALTAAGFDASLDGRLFSIYTSLTYQNANNAVRASDDFMNAVLEDKEWELKTVVTGEVVEKVKAKKLMREIAEAAWTCADPGMQYDTTINRWHTCPNSGRINGSNPCSEYMHLDDSACNLASINLLKFIRPLRPGEIFDVGGFWKAVKTTILAQEIIVGMSSYPTEKITQNALAFRELGLGYSNLGAMLMTMGIPYDSDRGRAWAAVITALMTGEAYRTSAEVAGVFGPCDGYGGNKDPMLNVISRHKEAAEKLSASLNEPERKGSLKEAAEYAVVSWQHTLDQGKKFGFRNTQTSVLAPTGTISFLMGCDTTGIEPELALVKYKYLVGGGTMKLVNNCVRTALASLCYSEEEIRAITEYITEKGTIENAPGLKNEHLPVFDCSLKPENGERFISWKGHVGMVAAVQPFISGAVSKTVNLPKNATVNDFEEAFIEAWKRGLKAITFYRDGSKTIQPLSTKLEKTGKSKNVDDQAAACKPVRRRLPDTRPAINHKFSIAGHEGYLTVGMYEDGSPGEIFITMAKEGSTLSGLTDAFAIMVSMGLQCGVPLSAMAKKFRDVRFPPSGFTKNKEIPTASSVVDYIFRWLMMKFYPPEETPNPVEQKKKEAKIREYEVSSQENGSIAKLADGPPCDSCGAITYRTGSCWTCMNCGTSAGCG